MSLDGSQNPESAKPAIKESGSKGVQEANAKLTEQANDLFNDLSHVFAGPLESNKAQAKASVSREDISAAIKQLGSEDKNVQTTARSLLLTAGVDALPQLQSSSRSGVAKDDQGIADPIHQRAEVLTLYQDLLFGKGNYESDRDIDKLERAKSPTFRPSQDRFNFLDSHYKDPSKREQRLGEIDKINSLAAEGKIKLSPSELKTLEAQKDDLKDVKWWRSEARSSLALAYSREKGDDIKAGELLIATLQEFPSKVKDLSFKDKDKSS